MIYEMLKPMNEKSVKEREDVYWKYKDRRKTSYSSSLLILCPADYFDEHQELPPVDNSDFPEWVHSYLKNQMPFRVSICSIHPLVYQVDSDDFGTIVETMDDDPYFCDEYEFNIWTHENDEF